MNSKTTAVIVCGGRGSRLGPLSEIINKNLLPYDGAPILLGVVRTAIDTFGCERCVFLTGHLGEQIESVMRSYISDSELIFIKDETIHGTAAAVQKAISSLEIDTFLYIHGNIAIGKASLLRLIEAVPDLGYNQSLVAVSDKPIATTHPRLSVKDNVVIPYDAAGKSVYSVGLGLYRGVAKQIREHPDTDDLTLEDWMSQQFDTLEARTIDIGDDWKHLESLDFYKSQE